MAKAESDTFLAQELGRNRPRPSITLLDGLRFGIGATVGFLAVAVTVSGLSWAMITLFAR